MPLFIKQGDLLNQEVEVIINTWNRNIIPWWLLVPQGVSGAIKRKAGIQPFIEIAKAGPIPLGGAFLTSAGKLPFKAIIHVAGINMFWRASRESIFQSTLSAISLIEKQSYSSAAFPAIGAGSGGFKEKEAIAIMTEAFHYSETKSQITFMRFKK
ncbi:macro domain-containing protein [Acidovorax sp. SUPP950]|uniref:macro domain-containing protein n=1 Tax=Acidovorax sp. SUPP950 TaxID=511901 RepID=UPI0023D3250F|nr:macro domain-containing protein [Acidovorax sp. SUPP950]GKS77991.1 macro domain-containing protein [Acidovorax sp. SUPP950]